MVEIKIKTANRSNYGGKRSTADIKYIVIHYTANDGDTAKGNGNYFANNKVGVSAHYFVDDDVIINSVPDDYIAWSVGGNKYKYTKGATFFGKCTNANSISIELCDTKKNGVYDFTEVTMKNAADLVKLLMKKYTVPVERVIRHYDVTGKVCPKPFVDDEKAWKEFKERLVDNMEKRYNKISELPQWAKPTIQKLVNEGKIADGNKLDMSEDMLRVLVIVNR